MVVGDVEIAGVYASTTVPSSTNRHSRPGALTASGTVSSSTVPPETTPFVGLIAVIAGHVSKKHDPDVVVGHTDCVAGHVSATSDDSEHVDVPAHHPHSGIPRQLEHDVRVVQSTEEILTFCRT